MQLRNLLTLLCLAILGGWQLLGGVGSLGGTGYRHQPSPLPADTREVLTQPAFGAIEGILQSPEQRLVVHLGGYYAFYRWLGEQLDDRAVIAISTEEGIGKSQLPALLHRLRNLLYPRIVAPLTEVKEFLEQGLLSDDRAFYVLHLGPHGPSLPSGSYQRMRRSVDYEFGRYLAPLGGGH